ncbi:zinc finger protein HIT domain-containing protein, putative [Perkinsus marinus ATCC 50983]|uniref:Zinc finger protein HIT domain-containing protein, putative n=1 Tax=Perkinsus marinus (strain ATCC 50983 / TXsc) TaxID=423536 RepID=C5LNW5_PERM5|nr:zinc finger protein HIT domain-containing protein, putative [Perkinsus marinus ATCC 50983]EER01547.1 zinc finger protein HIT domain-containing protein, putative [Perkinsus marinus ATCC 50983]|eukprot:XP_002768829.1 zinc finger protein HIT domain-containing protein, putative [Perkinsus marinus ATCC 50983]
MFVEVACSAARRSERARRIGGAMKRVDDETRRQVAESRLLALERDQASGAVDTYDAADDIGDPKHSVIGTKRERRTLEMILIEDRAEAEKNPNPVDTFENCEVEESRYPSVKICSVCLFLAKYQCVRCGTLYCSKRCHDIHQETQCIKFAE